MAESLHILLGTSACLQWLCHSDERIMAHGPLVYFYTLPHNNGGILWFHVRCLSVRHRSVRFLFPDDNLSTHQWIFTGYYGFTLVVCVSVGPSARRLSVRFSFPDDDLSTHQWIFTKLGMCIDIVEIWFGIANGQISSILRSYLP